jgi:hypothetical protein
MTFATVSCNLLVSGIEIVPDNVILGQVHIFIYLDFDISYREEKDIDCKITKFVQVLGLQFFCSSFMAVTFLGRG